MSEHEQILGIIENKNASPISLGPGSTALVVVDMQNYFTRPDPPLLQLFEAISPGSTSGYLGRVESEVIPNIGKLLAAFRERRLPIFYTAVGSEAGDGADLPGWLRGFDEMGLGVLGTRVIPDTNDPSWLVDERLGPKADEPVLNKLSAGTFATTDLGQRLAKAGVTSVVVTGVTSDVCVATTARESADRGFQTVLVSDACTTLSEEMHRGSIEAFNLAFGWVRRSDEVVELVGDSA